MRSLEKTILVGSKVLLHRPERRTRSQGPLKGPSWSGPTRQTNSNTGLLQITRKWRCPLASSSQFRRTSDRSRTKPLAQKVGDPDCGKQFKGKRGLSLHSRAAHAESYHSKGTAEIAETFRDRRKNRWANEETALIGA